MLRSHMTQARVSPIELSQLSPSDVQELKETLRTHPSSIPFPRVQVIATEFGKLAESLLEELDRLFVQHPKLELRLYSFLEYGPVDVTKLSLLCNLQHLKLHYYIPELLGVDALASLTNLRSAELGVVKNYSLDFLQHWQKLESLNLVRESKASVKPNFDIIGELPNLSEFMSIGYHNGVQGISRSASLKRIVLQDLKLKSWDFLPSHTVEYLRLNNVKCADPIDVQSLSKRCETLDLVRMNKLTGFDPLRAFSTTYIDDQTSSLTFQLDYVSQVVAREATSGHQLAALLAREVPPPTTLSFDPEADSLSCYGKKQAVEKYRHTLTVFFSSRTK